jgi:hypothetical protein
MSIKIAYESYCQHTLSHQSNRNETKRGFRSTRVVVEREHSIVPTHCPPKLARIQIERLVLDMYDSAYQDLVWRGRVSKAIGFIEDPGKR